MSANTSIQWTDRSWNPIRGCSRVSPGCDNCYAMKQAHRFAGPGQPYEGLTVLRPKTAKRPGVDWSGRTLFVPAALKEPLRWRKPQRIFVNSMSDLFHESLSNEQIAAVFGVMAACPRHTFQVLTKRPIRAREWFRWVVAQCAEHQGCERDTLHHGLIQHLNDERPEWRGPRWQPAFFDQYDVHTAAPGSPGAKWPLPNVWLGVSVEDRAAKVRIDELRDTPAASRFLSCEPLIEDLGTLDLRGVDWVIVGGESGAGARPCALEWIESIVSQARESGAAPFVKQLGAFVVSEHRSFIHADLTLGTDEEAKVEGFGSRWLWRAGLTDRKGGDMSEWPQNLAVREFPRSETA